MSTEIAPLDIEVAAEPDGGLGALATSRGNLPLDAVDVRAAIAGLSASVELTQGFHNPFDVPLEATYIFPLPDRAAVTAMRMEAAGHVVEGVLKERSLARADYDEAIAQGRRAAIAEEDRPDVFTMRVGNIAPGEQVTVRLTLAQPLPYQDSEVTFRFPLVVAPRYIPGRPLSGSPAGSGVAADTDAVPDASRISPPVLLPGFPNPVRLTLSAEIDPAGLPLAGIRCSLPATAEEPVAPDRFAEGHGGSSSRSQQSRLVGGHGGASPRSQQSRLVGGHGGSSSRSQQSRIVVRLRPGERLDRDFILRMAVVSHERMVTSLVLTEDPGEGEAEGTFSLTLVPPPGPVRPRPRDVVLVLDRSGSMHGWKIVAARRAAARIVDTLTDADRFAVLCFDQVVERAPDLPTGLAEATDRNRFRAIEHLARTDARGGTEMLGPLEDAVRLLTDASEPETVAGQPTARDRVLILVTDGQVGNEDQILNRIGPSLDRIRVHVVGIDQAVNAGFLSRLAAAGRGRCELVESEERLDEAAAHIHRRIGAPLVTALVLAADGLRIEPDSVAPRLLPDVFPGVPVTVAGRWRGQAGGTVTVTGSCPDGAPFEAKVVAAAGGTPAGTANWARAHLRDLEDRYASLAGYDVAELSRLEQRITDVSLRYGVLCRFTAFVAVDSRVVTDGTAPHRVTQPVELPAGWHATALGAPRTAVQLSYHGPRLSGGAAAPEGTIREHDVRLGSASPMRPDRVGGAPAAGSAPATGSASAPQPGPQPGAAARRPGSDAGAPHPGGPPTGARPGANPLSAGGAARARSPRPAAGKRRPQLVRDQLAAEVAALRQAQDAADAERLRFLADLATRLDALLAGLAGDPVGTEELTRLAELVVKLHACDSPGSPRGAELDALWTEAIRLLTWFTQQPAGDVHRRATQQFWKRRP